MSMLILNVWFYLGERLIKKYYKLTKEYIKERKEWINPMKNRRAYKLIIADHESLRN